MLMRRMPSRRGSRGFSLVELMIALVVGLIVIGAVLALVLSIIQSNNQTIQATRLTQELRATAAVIAADLKRARSVDDPLTMATATAGNPYATIDTATAGCIRYGYENAPGGEYRVVRVFDSKIWLATIGDASAGDDLNDAPCSLAEDPNTSDQLSSAQVDIVANPGGTPVFNVVGRRIDITLTGALSNGDPGLTGVTRTITQSVFVRSVGG